MEYPRLGCATCTGEAHMHATFPSRITIDFREEVPPSHGWIIGATPGTAARIELLAVAQPSEGAAAGRRPETEPLPVGWRPPAGEPLSAPSAVVECCCPEFCELDHENG